MVSLRSIFLRLRCYSTCKEAKKLWVKNNGSPSIKVSIENCTDIDDFAKKVKQELNTISQVALYTSIEKEALRPGLKITELFNRDEFMKNSDQRPLFVKLIPEIQDPIESKTIYIRDIDEECKPLDTFTQVVVENDADMKEIYENNGSALYLITDPKKRLTKFKQLKDGEKYGVFSRYEHSFNQELRWQPREDMAMEAELLLL